MPVYNPHEWTDIYVRYHENECVDILERLCGTMQDCIRERDFKSSIICCDGICEGLSRMSKRNPDRYVPMLYAHSYILAELMLFGVGGSRGIQAAIPPLKDALDFAKDCARPGRRTAERAGRDAAKIENMLRDLSRGVSLDALRRTYCPDFPHDILGD